MTIPLFTLGDKLSVSQQVNPTITAANAVLQMTGDGIIEVLQTPGGITLRINQEELRRRNVPDYFYAKITGPTPTSGHKSQWTYAFEEVISQSTGYGGWITKSGGKTGTSYNLVEDANADTGTQGNGVGLVNGYIDGTGLQLQPCPQGTIVMMYEMRADTMGYYFTYENGVDGSCDPPPTS